MELEDMLDRKPVALERYCTEHERISFPGWIRIFEIDARKFVVRHFIGRLIVDRIGSGTIATIGRQECGFRRQHSDQLAGDPLADHASHELVSGRARHMSTRSDFDRLVVRKYAYVSMIGHTNI